MINDRTIEIQEGGVRLDAAILHVFPTSTRAFIREAIADGAVLVDGRRTIKGLKLKGGENILIRQLLETTDNKVLPVSGSLTSVHEDEDLLAFDKPAGIPVQPLSCRETGTLMNAVVARHPECATVGDCPLMAGALHRIDADTSGLVMVARNQTAFDDLREQFSAHTIAKTYLALVEGTVATGGTLENDLIHDPTLPFCRMIDLHDNRLTNAQRNALERSGKTGLHAVTRFKPIGHTTVENEERSLLEVTIFTGVTHQIRAQLAFAGLHIVNDRLYGAFAVENQTGHCLHALAVKFKHPRTGIETEIRTDPPGWAQL